MSGFMEPTMEQGTYDWLPEALAPINEYIGQLQKMKFPSTSGVQQGIQNLTAGTQRIQPAIEQSLMGILSGQDFSTIDKLLSEVSNKQYQKNISDVMARTGRGTARMRALTGAAGDYATNLGLSRAGLRLEDLTRRMGAANQLAGLPSQLWSPVTSAEQSLLGMLTNWDLAKMGQIGAMYSQIPNIYSAGSYGYMEPSAFSTYLAPFLNALGQGTGMGLGYGLMGGGK
jgi:hypothetical protein